MFKVAHISNGIVSKVTVKTQFTPSVGLVDVTNIPCGPGWAYDGTTFTPPVPTAEELAKQAFAERLQSERETLKQDTAMMTFIDLTPTQVNTYIDNNVTDLASARQVLKLLARMVLILVRREFRD